MAILYNLIQINMKNILLISTIFLLACTVQREKKNASLKASGKIINITIPTNIRQPINQLSTYIDSSSNVYLYSWEQNQLFVIDLLHQKIKKNKYFKREGSNSISRIGGVYVKSYNEIYLWDANQPLIYQIDSTDNIIKRIHYPKTDDGKFLIQGYSVIGLEASIENGVINTVMHETDYYEGIKPNLEIDTINHSIRYSDFNFVKVNSDGECIAQNYHRRCNGENGFVYSLPYDHGIYIMDKDHRLNKVIRAQSNYIKELDYTYISPYDPNGLIKNKNKPFYGNILYDKYRNIYYRLAFHTTDCIPAENTISYLQFGRTDYSIMVLDNDFKCIAERLFNDHRYSSSNMFVAPDGLYISRSHCYNEDYSDDLLQYERFDLIYN